MTRAGDAPITAHQARMLARIARRPGSVFVGQTRWAVWTRPEQRIAWRLMSLRTPLAVVIDGKLFATPEGREWLRVAGIAGGEG